MVHLSSPTRGGIPCPAFFGAALAFPLVLDLVSASLEDLGGAGDTGAMTGMAGEPSTTITPSSRTAMTSVTAEMSGGFPLADGRALEVAATEATAVADGAR